MSWREKIKSLLHNLTYLKQERGAVFVLTALMLPVLLGFMGFAYDVGNLYMHKARLQNVTDAAALAGAGVFKNPPNKETADTSIGEYVNENNEVVDKNGQIVKLKQKVDYKSGTQILEKEGGSVVTVNSPNHVQADAVARDYINKNKINLGNDIKTEELSALGYKGTNTTTVNGKPSTTGSVTTTINTETKKDTDAVYYRIIASEEVPLYFLPVIMDKKVQTVRTTSIAVLDNTTETIKTTTTTTNSNYTPPTPVGDSSIFNNLFTFSNEIKVTNRVFNPDLDNLAYKEGNARVTYEGKIVSTKPNARISEAQEYDIFKRMFFDPDAKKVLGKVIPELMDQYGYYSEYNPIAFDSDEYQSVFSNIFNSAIEIDDPYGNREYIKVSDINKYLNDGTEFAGLKSETVNASNKTTEETVVKYVGHIAKGNLYIDEALSKTLYLMYPNNHQQIKVYLRPQNGQKSVDNVKPIILVYLGNSDITFDIQGGESGVFRGVIYAPNAQVQFNSGIDLKFYGNVMAKTIELKTDQPTSEFHLVNYFPKLAESKYFKNLPTVTAAPSSNLTQEQFNDTLTEALNEVKSWGGEYSWVADNIDNLNAYDSLTRDQKKNKLKAYMEVLKLTYDKLADGRYANFQLSDLNNINVFPWDNYDSSSGSGTTTPQTQTSTNTRINTLPTQFRLINPRTETNPYFKENADI